MQASVAVSVVVKRLTRCRLAWMDDITSKNKCFSAAETGGMLECKWNGPEGAWTNARMHPGSALRLQIPYDNAMPPLRHSLCRSLIDALAGSVGCACLVLGACQSVQSEHESRIQIAPCHRFSLSLHLADCPTPPTPTRPSC